MEAEYAVQDLVMKLIKARMVESAHDLSEGGLIVALAESCMQNNLGFDINMASDIRKDAWLFGEAQSRVIVSVAETQAEDFEAIVGSHPFLRLGEVRGDGALLVDGAPWGQISDWKKLYDEALEKLLA
jgi:phosphoribosylformylglycinamidine synthase